MTRDDAALIGGIIILGLSFLVLIVLYGESTSAAAWTQAIGTIVAVFASIIIASRQARAAARSAREERMRRQVRDRKAAYLLMLRLASLLGDLEIKLRAAGNVVDSLPGLGSQIAEDVDAVLDGLCLRITWDEGIFSQFDLLPIRAGQYSGHVLYSAARFDRETPAAVLFAQKHGGDLETLAEKLRGNVQNMKEHLDLAREALLPLLDTKPDDA